MSVAVHILDGALPEDPTAWNVDGAGALLRFEGIVRLMEDSQPIAALRYEAYEPMASNQLRRLAQETVEKFGVLAVHVEHSRGDVPVGQCSFRLKIAAIHRREALQGMDYFIDRLKQDVPIWKQPLIKEQA